MHAISTPSTVLNAIYLIRYDTVVVNGFHFVISMPRYVETAKAAAFRIIKYAAIIPILFLFPKELPRILVWITHAMDGAIRNIAMLIKNIGSFTSVYLLHVLSTAFFDTTDFTRYPCHCSSDFPRI